MGDGLTIKSSRTAGKLKFTERQPPSLNHPAEYIRVTLEDRELASSSSCIYLYEPYDFVTFFDELAPDWKGFAGEKEWKSVEEDFAQSATSNGLGVVALRVTLESGLYEDDWCVQAIIHVEAGQLEDLALRARLFFTGAAR
ncbi:MAG TPA: DUF6228 family protein [Pyrinomonadaceae bacterium]|jgi:hypothetical protein|nr:DUF6228 family protein [Pyrinomonadaceae bacterium]